jgi:hypothetical protein
MFWFGERKKEPSCSNNTQEGIDHSHKSAGQGDSEPREGEWRRVVDKKTCDPTEESLHHYQRKPQQSGVDYRTAEHCDGNITITVCKHNGRSMRKRSPGRPRHH